MMILLKREADPFEKDGMGQKTAYVGRKTPQKRLTDNSRYLQLSFGKIEKYLRSIEKSSTFAVENRADCIATGKVGGGNIGEPEGLEELDVLGELGNLEGLEYLGKIEPIEMGLSMASI